MKPKDIATYTIKHSDIASMLVDAVIVVVVVDLWLFVLLSDAPLFPALLSFCFKSNSQSSAFDLILSIILLIFLVYALNQYQCLPQNLIQNHLDDDITIHFKTVIIVRIYIVKSKHTTKSRCYWWETVISSLMLISQNVLVITISSQWNQLIYLPPYSDDSVTFTSITIFNSQWELILWKKYLC